MAAPPGNPPAPPTSAFLRLARASALYALGSVSGRVVGLLLLPFVSRALTPDAFGQLDVLTTMGTAVTSVAVLGLDVAATRYYADLDERGRGRLFGSWLLIATVAVGVIAALALAAQAGGSPVLGHLVGAGVAPGAAVLVALYAAGNLYQVLGLTVLRNQGRALTYAAVSTAGFATYGVAVVVLVTRAPTVTSALGGAALGVSTGGVLALASTRRLVLSRPSRPLARRLLQGGLPLVPAIVATFAGELLNRAYLLNVSGADQVGFLSVALRFSSAGVLVLTGFQLAWLPHAFAQARAGGPLERIARDGTRIIASVGAVTVPLAVLAPELVRLVAGPDYLGGVGAVGYALSMTVGMAMFLVAGMPSSIHGSLRDLGVAGTVGAVTGVLANLAFASWWGATGTAAALALGQAVGSAHLITLGRRRLAMPLPPATTILALAAVGVSVACTAAPLPLVVRLGLAAAYAAALGASGIPGESLRAARNAWVRFQLRRG